MVFIVAIIALALLGIMGLAASDTAHLNFLMAANGQDAKAAFFLADSGANAGHEYLENAIASVTSSFYRDGTNASAADPDTTCTTKSSCRVDILHSRSTTQDTPGR